MSAGLVCVCASDAIWTRRRHRLIYFGTSHRKSKIEKPFVDMQIIWTDYDFLLPIFFFHLFIEVIRAERRAWLWLFGFSIFQIVKTRSGNIRINLFSMICKFNCAVFLSRCWNCFSGDRIVGFSDWCFWEGYSCWLMKGCRDRMEFRRILSETVIDLIYEAKFGGLRGVLNEFFDRVSESFRCSAEMISKIANRVFVTASSLPCMTLFKFVLPRPSFRA